MATSYDQIGIGYRAFRRPDGRIEAAIRHALGPATTIVNVGAGTGSYEPAGRIVTAVEPSSEMIRQRPAGTGQCVRGVAEALPFPDESFDAALAVLTVHHWPEPEGGLRELVRVAGSVVILTFDAAIHNSFWLFRDYFPAICELQTTNPLSPLRIAELIDADRIEPVYVPHDCVDGFGWAYWRRPHRYLDAAVRRCISAFGLIDDADVASGIERLRSDLDSGRWYERYAELLQLDAIDGGFRLVVRARR